MRTRFVRKRGSIRLLPPGAEGLVFPLVLLGMACGVLLMLTTSSYSGGRQSYHMAEAFESIPSIPPPTYESRFAEDQDLAEALVAPIVTADGMPVSVLRARLDRASEAVERSPHDLPSHDLAAEACDALGLHDEALDWMDRKKARIAEIEARFGPTSETRAHERSRLVASSRYRFARWIDAGADRAAMEDAVAALDLLREAERVAPADAAGDGRERYQRMHLEWLVSPPGWNPSSGDPLPSFLVSPRPDGGADLAGRFRDAVCRRSVGRGTDVLEDYALDDASRGIASLLSLGPAWWNADVLYALSLALKLEGRDELSHFARLRCLEVAREGRGSLHPAARGLPIATLEEATSTRLSIWGTTPFRLERLHARMRAAAERREDERTDYLRARLVAGLDPDSDPTFWDGAERRRPMLFRLDLPEWIFLGLLGTAAPTAMFGGYLTIAAWITRARLRRP